MMNFKKSTPFLITFITAILFGTIGFAQPVTDTYNSTGAPQSWTVPSCVTSAVFTVAGAQGAGNAFGDTGGNGAVITFSLNVNPGDVIGINVGGAGQNPGAGYGGGGSGQTSGTAGYNSGGGGGASTVTVNGAPYAIAAGGGGAGGGDAAGSGGAGGCATGSSNPGGFGTAGSGGTQSAGGTGGAPYATGGGWGTNGSLGQGGAGGQDSNVSDSPGGGGGGGYYGGGGGGSDYISFSSSVGGSGGGGGSSLVPPGAGCNSGVNTGNGYISITYTGGLNATATNTGAYCEGETIQLNGSGGVDYAWTGPNGFTSMLQNPTIPNSVEGMSGTYQLIVTDPNCPEADTATTVVTVNPMPTVDPTIDYTYCEGDNTTQVDFTGVLPTASFDWVNDNTNTGLAANGNGSITSFVGAAAAGIVEVSNIIVTPSTAFCTGDADTFSITVLPTPLIDLTSDTTICENGTATLNAVGSGGGGGPYIYHWDFTADNSATQVLNPSVSTTYSVYVENSFGCISATEDVDVTVLPPLSGTITSWDTICPTYSTDITATVSGGLGAPYDFVWSTGDTHNGVGSHSITVDPMVTTDYTVTITDGCESTPLVLTTNVRVAPLPVPQYLVLDPEQCEPAVFTIVNTTDPTMSQYNYWLVDGDQQFINQDTIVTDTLMAGLYDIQMIITSFEGCVDSLTFYDALDVKPKPVADFNHSPNPVTMFNTTVNFQNTSFNGYTYQWFFEDGYPSQSTQEDVDVSFPDGVTGTYDITLITTSQLGCSDTMDYELIVFPEVLIYAPNTFTPDGDEFNQDWLIHMEGVDLYDFELLIFNRWGEVVWESHDITVPWDGMYNGKPLKQGMYNWVVRTKDILNDGKYTYTGHVTILR